MRNKPMVDNTLALLGEQAASSKQQARGAVPSSPLAARGSLNVAVLVAVASTPPPSPNPAREEHQLSRHHSIGRQNHDADHELYVKRLSGNLLTEEEVLAQANDRHSELAKIVRKDTAYTLAKLLHNEDKSLAIGIGIASPLLFCDSTGGWRSSASLIDFTLFPSFTALLTNIPARITKSCKTGSNTHRSF